MKGWLWAALIFILLLSAAVAALLYYRFGLKEYVRARVVINHIPDETVRAETWRAFAGNNPERLQGGIFAGAGLDRVWLWSEKGLIPFRVDEFTVYSWFDGCSPNVLKTFAEGRLGNMERVIFTTLDQWRAELQPGDYVTALLTNDQMGGYVGNAREVYAYNFWLFLKAGMEARCAK